MLKIPNILTIGRIILVPILVFVFFVPGPLGDWLACGIFIIASFTDFVDGFLARLLKQQSRLGEMLDPIADKIIVVTALKGSPALNDSQPSRLSQGIQRPNSI